MRTFTSLASLAVLFSMTAICLGEDPAPTDATSPEQVSIEVRYLSISPKLLAEAGLKQNLIVPASPAKSELHKFAKAIENEDNSPIQLVSATTVVETKNPVCVQTLNDAQLKQLMEKAQGDRRVSYLSAPKMTLFDGQAGEVRDCSERPFVVDVDNARRTVVQSISEGIQLALRPRLKNRGITLDVQYHIASLVDVQAIAKNTDNQIQVPTVKSTHIELTATVDDGESLAIWSNSLPAESVPPAKKSLLKKKAAEPEGSTLVLLITARRVTNGTK